MGVSTNAILVWGCDLGAGDEIDYPIPVEEDDADGVWEWLDAEVAKEGLSLVAHCSYDYPMFVVTSCDHFCARRGDLEPLYEGALTVTVLMEADAAKLTAFAARITGKSPQDVGPPQWFLCSMWG